MPGSPRPVEKTNMDVEMSESESVQGEKKMECETENQSKTSQDLTGVQELPEKKMDDKDDNVPELLNTISDIVDRSFEETLTAPLFALVVPSVLKPTSHPANASL